MRWSTCWSELIAESSSPLHPDSGPRPSLAHRASAWRFIAGQGALRRKSAGILELTALSSIGEERWVPGYRRYSCSAGGPRRRDIPVSLLDGGERTADILPTLPDTVWIWVSAGSTGRYRTPGSADVIRQSRLAVTDDRTRGIVANLPIFPHLDNPSLPWTRHHTHRRSKRAAGASVRRVTRLIGTRWHSQSLSTVALTSSPRGTGTAQTLGPRRGSLSGC